VKALAGLIFLGIVATAHAGVASPDPLGPADPELGRQLQTIADDLGITPLAKTGRASLILVDLPDSARTGGAAPGTATPRPTHAGLAADSTLGAASIAKLGILTAAYDAAASGELGITPDVRRTLERMIRASKNPEATRMIEILGFERIAATLDNPRIGLHTKAGGLWVGKDYSGSKARLWRAEPHSGQGHAASAASVARFYALLDRGELVSPEASAAIREILSVTLRSSKFVAGLGAAAGVKAPAEGKPVVIPGYRILRKSGSYGDWQGDSALIEAAGRRYILVCILRDWEGGEAKLRKLAVRVDRMMAERGTKSD
jgi:beta-lactamase class A